MAPKAAIYGTAARPALPACVAGLCIDAADELLSSPGSNYQSQLRTTIERHDIVQYNCASFYARHKCRRILLTIMRLKYV